MFELICIMALMFLWAGVGKSAIGREHICRRTGL